MISQRSSRWSSGFIIVAVLVLVGFPVCVWLTHAHENDTPSQHVIGIDFGTSYTCVGLQKDKVDIIIPDQGSRCIPSYVSFTDDGPLVGEAAREQFLDNPERTIYGIKQLLGLQFSDATVQEAIKHLPFQVVNRYGSPAIQVSVNGKEQTFSPEEIVSKLFGRARELAEGYLGENVSEAVITVPTTFNEAQRQAIKDAGALIDLGVLRVINESTATSIGHSLDLDEDESHILVYDFGGGTLDVTLLELDYGVYEVLATGSNPHISGETLNQRVVDRLASDINKANNIDISGDKVAMHKLGLEVEKAKIALSSQTYAQLEIESFFNGQDYSRLLTRAFFEDIQERIFEESLKLIDQVFKDANRTKEETDAIVLAGGSSRIPKVVYLVESYFDGKRSTAVNPEDGTVLGAIAQAAVYSYDESATDCGFWEPNALSLGIDTAGGLMVNIIPRNYPTPLYRTRIFSTAADNQESVLIQVLEGERALSKGNKVLGKLELGGITPAPRGVPQIEVAFELHDNGTLRVIATDQGTGKNESITLETTGYTIGWQAVDRIVLEANQFFEEDQAITRDILVRYQRRANDGGGEETSANANDIQYWLEQSPTLLEAEPTLVSPKTESFHYTGGEDGTDQAKPLSHDEL